MTVHKVVQADAVEWLHSNKAIGSVVTCPPDPSAMGEKFADMTIEQWLPWFRSVVRGCLWTAGPDHPVVLYLCDRKYKGRLISKATVAIRTAEGEGAGVLWHKIVLRRQVGGVNIHRPGWDHLLALGGPGCRPGRATPDVMHRGPALWRRGFGLEAAMTAGRLAKAHGPLLVAPFCGYGTMLAVADHLSMDSIGIDIDPNMCARSETADLPGDAKGGAAA